MCTSRLIIDHRRVYVRKVKNKPNAIDSKRYRYVPPLPDAYRRNRRIDSTLRATADCVRLGSSISSRYDFDQKTFRKHSEYVGRRVNGRTCICAGSLPVKYRDTSQTWTSDICRQQNDPERHASDLNSR